MVEFYPTEKLKICGIKLYNDEVQIAEDKQQSLHGDLFGDMDLGTISSEILLPASCPIKGN